MLARYHGQAIPDVSAKGMTEPKPKSPLAKSSAGPTVDFMFGNLADDEANRLPAGDETIAALTALGAAMAINGSNETGPIPAAYTYFGQFIDHDITITVFDGKVQPAGGRDPLKEATFGPLTGEDVRTRVENGRSAELDLDSVYEGLAAEKGTEATGRMVVSNVSPAPFGEIPTADPRHDLPREPMDLGPGAFETDRKARIGDPRNDENLLVAQLHVAFLRSHNVLVDGRGLSFEGARTAIRRRYQWAVLHDFLPRVCDPDVVGNVLRNGASHWVVKDRSRLFMPVEFSGAAYRFGHSMVRQAYTHNRTFVNEPFTRFFTFTALSGNLAPGAIKPEDVSKPENAKLQSPTLPRNWIIEWHHFFGTPGDNPARLIDTRLAPELGKLTDALGNRVQDRFGQLATLNLLRGYVLGLPTGQAVATRLGLPLLPEATLRAALPPGLAAASLTAIEELGLLRRTPLWFYVLAEAGDADGPKGHHLGPVGSRIVAETLWTLARFAKDSVIETPPTEEELATGEFSLKGLIGIGLDAKLGPLG